MFYSQIITKKILKNKCFKKRIMHFKYANIYMVQLRKKKHI